MVIAIDGPAGSGKSTIARLLAEGLASRTGRPCAYLNSGGLYRAITLGCVRQGVDTTDETAALSAARAMWLECQGSAICLDGEDVSAAIHTDEIDRLVAPLSANVPIRHLVNAIIRRTAEETDVVAEGRDMTTVVFPDAAFRFYLDASVDARARRRYEQGVSNLSLEECRRSIEERDEIDKNKGWGALRLAQGIRYIDTSDLTLKEVYDRLVAMIQREGLAMDDREVVKGGSPEDTNSIDETGIQEAATGEVQTQMQEEYLKSLEQLEEGQLVDGVVIQVAGDQVFVDVGYKSEGKIPLSEFEEPPKVGDSVTVVLVAKENKHGEVIVSKQKADAKIFWKTIRQAFQDHTLVKGRIDRVVKGGYEVNLGGDTTAFLPLSQADVARIEKPEKLVGMEIDVYVERLYSEGKSNVVVNRRKWLEEDIEKKRAVFFENVPVGSEVSGTVKSFTSFGAFVDLGGFDGLLHINDMSWGHVVRPKDFVKKGQKIRLKVIKIDPNEKRINLSMKHFTDDPWVHFDEKYHVNDIVRGKVTKLTEFGAFIELEEGIEGLAHISEFSWVRKVKKPSEVLNPGDEVECMILGYDLQAGRVSLGLKQVTANPWTGVEEKYPVGTRLRRKVVKITNAGAFIELEEGIDGFLHVDNISWTKKIRHPETELEVGQEVEVMVIDVESANHNIRLGIKQLSDDPWRTFANAYKPGSTVEGEVASITDFGLFVKVPGDIEGLIHKSNLCANKDDDPDEVLKKYKIGDSIKAVVIDIQPDKQKAAFSIRDYAKKTERDEISQYMSTAETDDSFTLGDFLKSKESNQENGE